LMSSGIVCTNSAKQQSKYPPAKPVALICEPLKAANRWR
jgi:hypothetical protein